MNFNLGFWNKLTSLATLVAVVVGIGLVGLWYKPLLDQNQRLRKEISRLDFQIKQEEATCRILSNRIDAIEKDPKTVARLAREKLGYAKPNETIIRFDPPSTAGSVQ